MGFGQRLLSRKFLLSIFGVILQLCNYVFELGIPEETFWGIITFILGFVVVEGAADVVGRAKSDNEK